MKRRAWEAGWALAVWVLSAPAHAQTQPTIVKQRLDVAGRSIEIERIHAPAGGAELSLVAGKEVGRQGLPSSLQTLSGSALAGTLGRRSRHIASAGFAADAPESPLGLLISRGKVISAVDRSPMASGAACRGSAPRLRYDGVLCVPAAASETARWRIVSVADALTAGCSEAVQAGPRLITDGAVQACGLDDAPPAPRMVACIDRVGDLHLARAPAVAWMPLVHWLHKDVGCVQALALAGDKSGWMQLPVLSNPALVRSAGDTVEALPSLLVLRGRR